MDMDGIGKNFVSTKLLIDTGALIPSGVAISEQFFIDNFGGDIADLLLSEIELSKWG